MDAHHEEEAKAKAKALEILEQEKDLSPFAVAYLNRYRVVIAGHKEFDELQRLEGDPEIQRFNQLLEQKKQESAPSENLVSKLKHDADNNFKSLSEESKMFFSPKIFSFIVQLCRYRYAYLAIMNQGIVVELIRKQMLKQLEVDNEYKHKFETLKEKINVLGLSSLTAKSTERYQAAEEKYEALFEQLHPLYCRWVVKQIEHVFSPIILNEIQVKILKNQINLDQLVKLKDIIINPNNPIDLVALRKLFNEIDPKLYDKWIILNDNTWDPLRNIPKIPRGEFKQDAATHEQNHDLPVADTTSYCKWIINQYLFPPLNKQINYLFEHKGIEITLERLAQLKNIFWDSDNNIRQEIDKAALQNILKEMDVPHSEKDVNLVINQAMYRSVLPSYVLKHISPQDEIGAREDRKVWTQGGSSSDKTMANISELKQFLIEGVKKDESAEKKAERQEILQLKRLFTDIGLELKESTIAEIRQVAIPKHEELVRQPGMRKLQ